MDYIETNPKQLVFRFVFDCDQPDPMAWDDGTLPPPNWTAINPVNGHSHHGYEIGEPVTKSAAARTAPIRYAAAIERELSDRLDADVDYVGRIMKNPHADKWDVLSWRSNPYDLGELAEYVDLRTPHATHRVTSGLGRNVALFDLLRKHAYGEVAGYRVQGESARSHWHRQIEREALAMNSGGLFATPLPISEVRHTAKSVAKWTWEHYRGRMPDEDFSRLQAYRGGMKGAKARQEGLRLLSEGLSVSDVAKATGKTERTVRGWRAKAEKAISDVSGQGLLDLGDQAEKAISDVSDVD